MAGHVQSHRSRCLDRRAWCHHRGATRLCTRFSSSSTARVAYQRAFWVGVCGLARRADKSPRGLCARWGTCRYGCWSRRNGPSGAPLGRARGALLPHAGSRTALVSSLSGCNVRIGGAGIWPHGRRLSPDRDGPRRRCRPAGNPKGGWLDDRAGRGDVRRVRDAARGCPSGSRRARPAPWGNWSRAHVADTFERQGGPMTDTVLILDDSLTVRMDLAEAFESSGFRPLSCATLAEAREALARESVSVAVLDVLLPDGDGVDLLREIRASPIASAITVLILSTEAEVKDRIRGLRTGADEYVGKPYDASYVVAKARQFLRARSAGAAADRPTILIIDDSVTFREEMRQAFTSAGYAVLVATSGEEGLQVAADQRPSAIVVDGVLPGIDGATVIRHVRLDAALRGIPCLLLTASEDQGAELRALDAGADAFVHKEEEVEVILAKLAATLRGAAVAGAEATASLLGPKRILAVDDSVTYLEELASTLRGEGYDVVLARSGEEAIELLAVQSVDCILLDLVMPGLGGQETCRLIKSAPVVRDIPLIMLTALEGRAAMLEGFGAGADDYISKS